MSGPFNTPPRARKPAINITPLIDVMFLLLIFFMVSSTFREYPGIDVALPTAANATAQDTKAHTITVKVDGTYHLDGEPKTALDLKSSLATLVEENKESTFILEADENVRFEAVVRAIDIAKDVGGDRLIIPTDFPDPDADPRQP